MSNIANHTPKISSSVCRWGKYYKSQTNSSTDCLQSIIDFFKHDSHFQNLVLVQLWASRALFCKPHFKKMQTDDKYCKPYAPKKSICSNWNPGKPQAGRLDSQPAERYVLWPAAPRPACSIWHRYKPPRWHLVCVPSAWTL